VDVGDEGATLAGDGLAMAMGPLGHHHHHHHNHEPAPGQPQSPNNATEAKEGGAGHGHAAAAAAATKGGWVANLYLALAIMTFAANNSALIWAIQKTGATTCNILCAAQMIGIVTFGPLFYKDLTWTKIRALRWRDWAAIVVASMARNVVGAYFDVEGMRETRWVRSSRRSSSRMDAMRR
jgi:hypothetical protein